MPPSGHFQKSAIAARLATLVERTLGKGECESGRPLWGNFGRLPCGAQADSRQLNTLLRDKQTSVRRKRVRRSSVCAKACDAV